MFDLLYFCKESINNNKILENRMSLLSSIDSHSNKVLSRPECNRNGNSQIGRNLQRHNQLISASKFKCKTLPKNFHQSMFNRRFQPHKQQQIFAAKYDEDDDLSRNQSSKTISPGRLILEEYANRIFSRIGDDNDCNRGDNDSNVSIGDN